ncbi:MAG: hypothetical protein ACPG51_18665 [Thiolinea sp.]
MRTITERLRLLLLYLTTFALLAGQGVNAHIHLFEAHHHDGSHHQHSAEIHTDHFADHDVSILEHSGVVDLDVDGRVSSPEKQKNPLLALVYDPFELGFSGAAIRINQLLLADGWLDYPELATRHPRAPPINI